MFVNSLVAMVIGFITWGAYLTVRIIGRNRVPVTPELAARVLFLASVLIGALTYVFMTADATLTRFYLLPAAGLLIGGAVGTILKVGQIRKPLTSGIALIDIVLDLSAIVFLAAFLVGR